MTIPRVLVVGFSTRAIGESAARAGFTVASLDAFGDIDQRACPAIAAGRDLGLAYDPVAIARAARTIPAHAVAYVASFENHPDAVALLSRGRTLLGNTAAVLRRARDPLHIARVLRAHGFAAPDVRLQVPPSPPSVRGRPPAPRRRWLVKPLASGGGHGSETGRATRSLRRTEYLQQHIRGEAGSLVFASDARSSIPFAVSHQLIGEPEFGASGFRYCGSILAMRPAATFARGDALVDAAGAIADTLARELHLVGVNGFDFIARDGVPFVTEVNPRYTASMELAERAFELPVFGAHVDACSGRLPRFDLAVAERGAPVVGKAVLFARRTVTLPNTSAWLERDDVRDIPHPGERIMRGSPICTIFARGGTVAACRAALVRRARKLYDEIGGRGRRSA